MLDNSSASEPEMRGGGVGTPPDPYLLVAPALPRLVLVQSRKLSVVPFVQGRRDIEVIRNAFQLAREQPCGPHGPAKSRNEHVPERQAFLPETPADGMGFILALCRKP